MTRSGSHYRFAQSVLSIWCVLTLTLASLACADAQAQNRLANGALDRGKQCDDGNLIDRDGCSPSCTVAQAGINAWTSHGPEGGTVSALAINPPTPTTLYAVAGTFGDEGGPGGVFKSTDRGSTWNTLSEGLPDIPVRALAIDPIEPRRAYAGTAGGGVFAIEQVSTCVGDCTGDGQVSVDELLTMVNIALGTTSIVECGSGDANHDNEITIDEILTAVNVALLDPAGIRVVNLLLGGENGNPGSAEAYRTINPAAHYGDLIPKWINGETVEMRISRAAVTADNQRHVKYVPAEESGLGIED
jgi:cysteine-rich repeat protein